MTMRAILDGVVLAEAADVVTVEGNAYFPPESVRWQHLQETDVTSRCWWKGRASYYDAVVNGETHPNVGWTYHDPSRAASDIVDHVAFWGAVSVDAV